VADLALIRLARLYGLPMTGYEAAKILKTILFSSGLLLGELGSSLLLGLGKSTAAIASGENPTNLSAMLELRSLKLVSLVTEPCGGDISGARLHLGAARSQHGNSRDSQSGGITILYRLRQELGQQLESGLPRK